jgi:type IV pilus assembly protein PilA
VFIALIAFGAIGLLIAILGIVAVLGIYGTRKYIASAKQAEARSSLGMMAKAAVAAYEREELPSNGPAAVVSRRLCPSALSPVPEKIDAVAARKYQSTPSEWRTDPGFSCLRFELSSPQYYQYNYTSVPDAFSATALGDLDGDGAVARFELRGSTNGGTLAITPQIVETNPDE